MAELEDRHGSRFTLRSVTVIGRSETAHICLSDLAVSYTQAHIYWRQNQWEFVHLSDSSTTFHNGKPAKRDLRTPLKVGDLLAFGKTENAWTFVSDSPPRARATGHGCQVFEVDGVLVFPSEADPQVVIGVSQADPSTWTDSRSGDVVRDEDSFVLRDGTSWTVHLPTAYAPTRHDLPRTADVAVTVYVDKLEEWIHAEVGGTELKPRSGPHFILLLQMARAMSADASDPAVSAAERGFRDTKTLARELGIPEDQIATNVQRLRNAMSTAVSDPWAVVDRKARTGRLRLGFSDVCIIKDGKPNEQVP